MNETETTFNQEKIADIVKDFTDADYEITKVQELYMTSLMISNEYQNEKVTNLAYADNGTLGFENNKVAKELYTQVKGNIYMAYRYEDFYIVELENERKIGYIIVRVINGALMSKNKKKVFLERVNKFFPHKNFVSFFNPNNYRPCFFFVLYKMYFV